MNCKQILIVDDENSLRECISDILTLEGYEVVQASDGQKALEYLKSLQLKDLPGIILLDLMMPVMDGVTFLHEIKEKHKGLQNIPVVVISACHHDSNDSSLDYAVERLNKPFEIEEIYRIVRKYCGDPEQLA